MTASHTLRRQLGLSAVVALVVGNMLGSGVFFTPGELAAVAQHPWQVHFIWALCGLITLCGSLTLAELCRLLPQAGASYHVLREAFGPLSGFVLVWMELWVSGPGSVAGIAIAFGEFMHRVAGSVVSLSPLVWGVVAIAGYAAVNLAGVTWGGRVQVVLTTLKVGGIAALIGGALLLAAPAAPQGANASHASLGSDSATTLGDFIRFVGLGVAAVLFTYDGWIDVSHVAGEVRRPERDLPVGMALGVASLTVLYLIVNLAYLRVVPLAAMRVAPTAVATTVATAAYGPRGGSFLDVLMLLSIFGALGGLVMTLPRLFFTLAESHRHDARGALRFFFERLAIVSPRTSVPSASILFTAATSIAALLFFGSFSRLVNFFVVPFQLMNILMVGAIFRLRPRLARDSGYRTPGYPLTPAIYMVVMAGFIASAVLARPMETLIGTALAATGVPIYFWLVRR